MKELLTNLMGSRLTLFQVAYLMENCGSSLPDHWDLRNDTAAAFQAAELYHHIKTQFLMEFLHKRAMRYKAYNGVIGPLRFPRPDYFDLPDSLAISDSLFITAPSGILPNDDTLWWQPSCCNSPCGFSPHRDTFQISNIFSYDILHLKKQKRWGRTDELLGLDTAWFAGQIGRDIALLDSFQCHCSKNAQDLELFFRTLFSEELLRRDTTFTLDSCSVFPTYLLAPLAGLQRSPFTITHSPNADTLFFSFEGAPCALPNYPNVQILLAIPPTAPPIRWTDTFLLSLQYLQYQGAHGGAHHFTLSLWGYTDSLWKISVQVQTCFDLSCPSGPRCDTSCLSRTLPQALEYLFRHHPLTSLSPYTPYTFDCTELPHYADLLGCLKKLGLTFCPLSYSPEAGPSSCFYLPLSDTTALLSLRGYRFFLTLKGGFLGPDLPPPPCTSPTACCNTIRIGGFPTKVGSSPRVDITFYEGSCTDRPLPTSPLCLIKCPPPPSSCKPTCLLEPLLSSTLHLVEKEIYGGYLPCSDLPFLTQLELCSVSDLAPCPATDQVITPGSCVVFSHDTPQGAYLLFSLGARRIILTLEPSPSSLPPFSYDSLRGNRYILRYALDCPSSQSCCNALRVLFYHPDDRDLQWYNLRAYYYCSDSLVPLCLANCRIPPPPPPDTVRPSTSPFCADIPPFPPLPEPADTTSPCLATLIATAIQNAYVRYETYIDSLYYGFIERYMAHCRKVREQFTIRLPYEGDYYVLYLYDEIGNLVATVPPEGVRPLGG